MENQQQTRPKNSMRQAHKERPAKASSDPARSACRGGGPSARGVYRAGPQPSRDAGRPESAHARDAGPSRPRVDFGRQILQQLYSLYVDGSEPCIMCGFGASGGRRSDSVVWGADEPQKGVSVCIPTRSFPPQDHRRPRGVLRRGVRGVDGRVFCVACAISGAPVFEQKEIIFITFVSIVAAEKARKTAIQKNYVIR